MTAAVATKETESKLTTHGVMSVNFSVDGINAEDLMTKFNSFLAEMNVSITNLDGEKVELQTLDFQIEKIESQKY